MSGLLFSVWSCNKRVRHWSFSGGEGFLRALTFRLFLTLVYLPVFVLWFLSLAVFIGFPDFDTSRGHNTGFSLSCYVVVMSCAWNSAGVKDGLHHWNG